MRTLIFAVLLGACHKEPGVDRAELERLRAEQRALAARVEALQAQIDRVPPSPPVPAVAPPVPPPPDVPRARPLLTNIDTSETGAVVTTKAPPPSANEPSPAGSLRTEDLHGAPVGGGASPLGGGASIGLGASGGSVSDAEGAAMLDQLQAQMKQLKSSQAAEQSALDQLEKMR